MPAPAGADPESPRPIAGPEAGAIGELVAKFLPAYLSAGSSKELSYLLTPRAAVVPLGGAARTRLRRPRRQLGDGEGPRRDLLVEARGPRTGRRRDLPGSPTGWGAAAVPAAGTSPRSRGRSHETRQAHPPRLAAALLAAALTLIAPSVALAAGGNSVGSNLAGLLREYAGELYTGIVAVFALVFLINRKFTELLIFFCAAIVVGWLVFAPGQVADTAKAIAHQVLP